MKRSHVLPAVVIAVAVMATSVILSACGGGGGGGASSQTAPKVQLSGTIGSTGNGYTHKASMASGFGNPNVNRVMAIPIMNGSLNGWSLSSSASSSIATDGSFSMSLDSAYDYVPVLIDTNVTGTGRYIGTIGANTGSSESILNIPVTQSILSTIALGTVSRPTTSFYDAVSSKVVGTADFSLSPVQLAALAKTDDVYKNIMNIVNNYGNFDNPADVWYYLRPNFSWRRTYSGLTTSTNLTSQPVYTYNRYQFQLTTNSQSVLISQLCPTNTVSLQLYPPAGTTVASFGTNSYHDNNPLQNDNNPHCRTHSSGNGQEQIEDSFADFSATNAYADAYQTMDYEFMTDFQEDIPAGYWTWKEDGVVKGMFDASVSVPKTTAGNPKGFVPAMYVKVDGTNKIEYVDIAWFYYDETAGQYVKLGTGDLGILKHVMQAGEVEFMNETDNTKADAYFDPTVTTRVVPPLARDSNGTLIGDGSWYFDYSPGTATPQTARSIIFFYESAGIGNYFEAFGPNTPGGGSGKPRRK
ncbi:MAG: hypothetical protein AABZ15_11510 [Nitrospirota bacterium]